MKEPAIIKPNRIPYLELTGLATIPGAALEEVEVLLLPLVEEAVPAALPVAALEPEVAPAPEVAPDAPEVAPDSPEEPVLPEEALEPELWAELWAPLLEPSAEAEPEAATEETTPVETEVSTEPVPPLPTIPRPEAAEAETEDAWTTAASTRLIEWDIVILKL